MATILDYQRTLEDLRAYLAISQLSDDVKVGVALRTVESAIAGVFEHDPPPVFEPQQCKSCGADIIWIRTVAGKQSPCDKKFRNVTTADGRTVRGHESHFSTCVNANTHRKEKR